MNVCDVRGDGAVAHRTPEPAAAKKAGLLLDERLRICGSGSGSGRGSAISPGGVAGHVHFFATRWATLDR